MNFSDEIDRLFKSEEWLHARKLLQARLVKEPKNHWLLARLSTTYYEERDYVKALKLAQKAIAIAPDCPLALWGLGCALEMTGDDRGALKAYRKLLGMGPQAATKEECGEGMAWARSLLADCLYSAAGCLNRIGEHAKAKNLIRFYMAWRGMLSNGIYSRKEAQDRYLEIVGEPLAEVIEQETKWVGRQLELV